MRTLCVCRREIVFLLLGAPRYSLGFGNLLRLTFIRINVVMNDDSIVSLFTDDEMSSFVKFALVLSSGDVLFDLKLPQAIPFIGADISNVIAYLDLPQIYHDVGVDLASAGPDPMSASEAFFLKLLWPGYVDCDEKYLAIVIAGILATRSEQDRKTSQLPPFSMHLTEVGMHLKLLEAVDASLAWALPSLKQEGLRLARFLGKRDTERYFSVSNSPFHHSDKVVSLNVPIIWEDASNECFFMILYKMSDVLGKVWSVHDVSSYLQDPFRDSIIDEVEIARHLEFLTRSCVESAMEVEQSGDEKKSNEKQQTIDPTNRDFDRSIISKLEIDRWNSQKIDRIRSRNIDRSNSHKFDIDRLNLGSIELDRRPFGRELDIANRGGSSRDPVGFSRVRSNQMLFGFGSDLSIENGLKLMSTGLDFDGENFGI